MLNYQLVRDGIETGDVLMVKARGIISRIIRAVTGESYNHVAMLVSNPSGVFVIEMREGKGWLMKPASQWMKEQVKSEVFWGKAPYTIRGSACVEVEALSHRGKPYSYWTLITVWIGQFTKRKHPGNLVCSTFIQACWKKCGYIMSKRLADPGDYPKHLKDVNAIAWIKI